MPVFDKDARLLVSGQLDEATAEELLAPIGFSKWRVAYQRFPELVDNATSRRELGRCLPTLLNALVETAQPDISLLNFSRFAQSVPDRATLYRYLADNPRAVEILVKLFVGSQFLTEILLRNPDYLDQITQHKRLAEIKSRPQFFHEAMQATEAAADILDRLDLLRRTHHWELLRIGACDSFGLMDLKTVTVQLSLLADAVVQTCLALYSESMGVPTDDFVVLAMGKLGGEELNYSSDIDLVFVARENASRYWEIGQKLINALKAATSEGFLYRVDMRLRPWGRSGPLVMSIKAHMGYLHKNGMLWEKQALLKARPIAGNLDVGREFLQQVEPLLFSAPVDAVRSSIREMKARIEAALKRQGKQWGEVKSGVGSIRDVEFVTQFLQLAHGAEQPHVRSINTLDGLKRLAACGYLVGDEYRQLTSGYMFHRTVEHALQLMHHKQVHSLPDDKRELAYLARRLDFPNTSEFVGHYEQHCTTIRAIYDKYIGEETSSDTPDSVAIPSELPDLSTLMEPDYTKVFTPDETRHHAELLNQVDANRIVVVDAKPHNDGTWRVTIAGIDQPGEMSMICGLLFVHGLNIVDGNVFTAQHVASSGVLDSNASAAMDKQTVKFVDVFSVLPTTEDCTAEMWRQYATDLADVMRAAMDDRRQAQAILAKRVGKRLRGVDDAGAALLPVDIQIDNKISPRSTVLHIRGTDTIGFLYELCNALALAGINIRRVNVGTQGTIVQDTLYVTDTNGEKLIDNRKRRELRSAVVLIKHFTHLLPRSPNPEKALLHFRDFLEHLFARPNWIDEISSLQQSDVLDALAKLLGVSDFLWQDFLRLQHENLFPVVKDVEDLRRAKPRSELESELERELNQAADFEPACDALNAFKDREMFRIDMRHILGHIQEFGQFSHELTDVADVVISAASRLCERRLQSRYGIPSTEAGHPCAMTVVALGKCGGRELGFASDIELMFIYENGGKTTGPEVITTTEYYLKFVERFTKTIKARRKGIFEIDLRLRPYGRAGSLAVSFDAFRDYFSPEGPAWPYERQALVKLRPVFGDEAFSQQVLQQRDAMVYMGTAFDVVAMRAMREKQVRQLVKPGVTNMKLSPGGAVDVEYLVQGLQITFGHLDPALRATDTLGAMAALEAAQCLSPDDHRKLHDAYVFQRRVIDALRMVRGDARDLSIPDADTDEYEYLARRLGYQSNPGQLKQDINTCITNVMELTRLLDALSGQGQSK